MLTSLSNQPPGQCHAGKASRRRLLPSCVTTAAAAARAQATPKPAQPARRLTAAVEAAATDAAALPAAAPAAQPLDDIFPYVSSRASQLKGRSLAANPAEGLWQAAARLGLQWELRLTALLDAHKAAPYVMSALAGALIGAGLDAPTLLQHGLPPYVPDLLLQLFGVWDTTLFAVALTAAALPITAWAARAWWRASLLLLDGAADTAQHIWQQQQQKRAASAGAAEAAGAAAAAAGSGAQQHSSEEQQAGMRQQTRLWFAAAVAVGRAVCISSAAGSFLTLLYTRGASNTAMALHAVAGVAALAACVAALLLLRPHSNSNSSSSSSSSNSNSTISSSSSQVLVPFLASEAGWLLAVLGVGPLASAAAAAVLAVSLYRLHCSVVVPAMQQYKAAPGDEVEVHVGLKLAGTQPVFDSTLSEQPVKVTVGPVPQELQQQWQAATAAAAIGSEQGSGPAQQQPQQADDSRSSGSSSSNSSSSSSSSSRGLLDVQKDVQRRVQQPSARWEALRPFIAAAADGLYLGQAASVPLYNPQGVGYWNPSFTWWQPRSEVEAKFGGRVPDVGEVFWYPVADGAAVPTRVNAVGQDYVELDANYGVTATGLELQVELVQLNKPVA